MIQKYRFPAVFSLLIVLMAIVPTFAAKVKDTPAPVIPANPADDFINVMTRDNPTAPEKLAADEIVQWLRLLAPQKITLSEFSKGSRLPGTCKIVLYIKQDKPVPLGKIVDGLQESSIFAPLGPEGYSMEYHGLPGNNMLVIMGADARGLFYAVQAMLGFITMGDPSCGMDLESMKSLKGKLLYLGQAISGLANFGKPYYAYRPLILPASSQEDPTGAYYARMSAAEFAKWVHRLRMNVVSGIPRGAKMSPKERGAWIATLHAYALDSLAPVDLRSDSEALTPEKITARLNAATAAYPGADGFYLQLPSAPAAKQSARIKAAVKAAGKRTLLLGDLAVGEIPASLASELPDSVWLILRWDPSTTAGMGTPIPLASIRALGARALIATPTRNRMAEPIGLNGPLSRFNVQPQFVTESYRAPNLSGFPLVLGDPDDDAMDEFERSVDANLAWSPMQFNLEVSAATYMNMRFGEQLSRATYDAVNQQGEAVTEFLDTYPRAKSGRGISQYLGTAQLKALSRAQLDKLAESLAKTIEKQRAAARTFETISTSYGDTRNPRAQRLEAQSILYREFFLSRAALIENLRSGATAATRRQIADSTAEMLKQIERLRAMVKSPPRKADLATLATALKAGK